MLIHIGYHKTGTTWIQDKVFHAKNSNFHSLSELGPHFVFDREGYVLNSFDANEARIRAELQRLQELTPNTEGRVPVLSYERLSGSPFSGGVNAAVYARRLHHIFPQAKILIAIRKQQEAILSGYFQYLTGGGTHGIKKYLSSKFNGIRPHFTYNHYLYHHLIGEYQNLFGKENVLVLPYEMFREDKSSYFQHLGEFVGREIDLGQIDLSSKVNSNHHQFVRYHFRFLNLFLRPTELNNFTPFTNRFTFKLAWNFRKTLEAIVPSRWNQKTTHKLAAFIESETRGRFEESNQQTDTMIPIGLAKYQYY